MGFTYNWYFRHVDHPNLDKDLSPLHNRCKALMSDFKEPWHWVTMDNLYQSQKFLTKMYKDNKVLCGGTCRTWGRGLAPNVIQKEVKSKSQQGEVRGTVRAAVLMNNPNAPNMLSISVYDTKPVHFLTMHEYSVVWVKCKRLVYNKVTRQNVEVDFWRMAVINNYNGSMGWVDVVDQLRNYYRQDKNMRNRKYWWPIYQWASSIMATNAYIVYQRLCDARNIELVDRISHLKFQTGIIMGLLYPPIVFIRRRTRRVLESSQTQLDQSLARRNKLRKSVMEGGVGAARGTRSGALKRKRGSAKVAPSSFRLYKHNWHKITNTRLDGLFHEIEVCKPHVDGHTDRCQFCPFKYKRQYPSLHQAANIVKKYRGKPKNDRIFRGEDGNTLWNKVKSARLLYAKVKDERRTKYPSLPTDCANFKCIKCDVWLCSSCYVPFHTLIDTDPQLQPKLLNATPTTSRANVVQEAETSSTTPFEEQEHSL